MGRKYKPLPQAVKRWAETLREVFDVQKLSKLEIPDMSLEDTRMTRAEIEAVNDKKRYGIYLFEVDSTATVLWSPMRTSYRGLVTRLVKAEE